MSIKPGNCGSYHCQGFHKVIHKGTTYEKLESINCGAMREQTKEELERYNSLEYAKELHARLTK